MSKIYEFDLNANLVLKDAILKDEVPKICRYCNKQGTVNKHGYAQSGKRRYYCVSCKRSFQGAYIYSSYKEQEYKLIDSLRDEGLSDDKIRQNYSVNALALKYSRSRLTN
ncbi:MAG: hypothetical protein LBN41_11400 [Enterobacteriaceae bacterium]|jgi:transposase-like protein|nr:hypothetical protein [Enterobacteriaceae bacterium]